MESISTSLTTLSTNNDTALCDDIPPRHLPPDDVLDDDHLGDDLLLKLLDRLFSDASLTSDLFLEELNDAYDLVTLDELLDGLSDLALLVIPLDSDLLDKATDRPSDDCLDLSEGLENVSVLELSDLLNLGLPADLLDDHAALPSSSDVTNLLDDETPDLLPDEEVDLSLLSDELDNDLHSTSDFTDDLNDEVP